MKKLALILALILALSGVGVAGMAEIIEPKEYTSGDYQYTLLDDGTAEITKYTGSAAEISIPAELDGHSVSSIGKRAFYQCETLKKVTIPQSVTSIGERAFMFCKKMISVSLPDSLTIIGRYAFYGCTALAGITIPESVTTLGEASFGVCNSLTEVLIPDSVVNFEAAVFVGCSNMERIGVSTKHPVLATIDGVLFDKTEKALLYYPCKYPAESYEIPQGILSISSGAFRGSNNLRTVIIPDSVTSIGFEAFSYCAALSEITIPDSVINFGSAVFWECHALTKIHVSSNHPILETIDGVLFDKSEKKLTCYPGGYTAESYEIPQGTEAIGDSAFFNNDVLCEIVIPDSVTSINYQAFMYCDSLSSIVIPSSVTSIGDDAFADCPNLTLQVEPGSYAEQYAKENGIPYETIEAATPAAADAADYEYTLLEDGTVMITAYNGSAERLVIPAELDGRKVIAIGYQVFQFNAPVKEIVLPEGLEAIGAGAFMNCFSLTSVTIPDSAIMMGMNPFIGCGKLTEIRISSDHPYFELRNGMLIDRRENKLIYCPYTFTAENYEIPQDIKVIGGFAFQMCERIDNIIVPSGVITIEDCAFSFCTQTESITIPASVTTIGSEVFTGCYSLTLQVESGSYAEQYAKENGIPYEIIAAAAPAAAERELVGEYTSGDYEYNLYSDGTAEISMYFGNAKELSIPAELDGHTVTSIGDAAFCWCTTLNAVTIPVSVTSIGADAFYHCDSLTSVTIPEGVTSIGADAFSNCDSMISIAIPNSVVELGVNVFGDCDSLMKISVSSNHPTLATIDGVLFDKTEKKLICYPCAFDAESYAIPQGILAIDDCAFYVCGSLRSITIPDSVTSIGVKAFYHCDSLTSVTIPDSVVELDGNPFGSCSSLTKISVSPNHPTLATIDGVLFDKAEKKLICYPCTFDAENYAIPQGILAISDYAFYNCKSLRSITIPDSVTSIGDNAFCWCKSLSAVTIPGGVTSIGDSVFYDCTSLSSVAIPGSVTSIDDSAFSGCKALRSITIPDSVTSIGADAFAYCSSLSSVTIPGSVTSIGDWAFNECYNLTLQVESGSCAEQYAKDNDIPYDIIENTDWLNA